MNEIVHVNIGADGQMSGFSHHDGTLVGLFVGEDDCNVVIKSSSGDRYVIYMGGVIDYSISSLWRFNIVDSIFVAGLAKIETQQSAWEGSALEVLSNGRFGEGDAELYLRRLRDRNERAVLLQVTSAYGGPLSFVCGSYEVRK